jgi:DNA-binding transcriptional regulator YbjK
MGLSAGERTRLQILEAALLVIAIEGIDSVTHRSVGREAGLSHGVVSYHFPTRDELIYKSFEHFLGDIQEHQARYGWKPNEKITKRRIIDILTAEVADELADRTMIRVEQELILYASRRPELAALYNAWEKDVVDALAGGLTRERFNQPQLTARILISLVRGFLLESLTNKTLTKRDFRKRANLLMTTISSQVAELT